MPSTLADDMWHEFLLHTRDYAAFCDAAFGQFLHHEPESTMSPDQAAANRSDGLLITLQRRVRMSTADLTPFPCSSGSTRRCSCKVAAAITWTAEGESSATTRRSQGWCACTIWLGRHC